MHTPCSTLRLLALLALGAPLAGACEPEPDVVLYSAFERERCEPLVRRFELEHGLLARVEYQSPSSALALAQRLREDRDRPRCDVFWNDEIARTVELAEDGLFASYDSPRAAGIPEEYRDPGRRWTGCAARACVLVVNTNLADPSEIRGVRDLLDPRWQGKACMARPLSGTPLAHAAALYVALGATGARGFFRALQGAGVNFVRTNAQVVSLVREGRMVLGLADTDEVERAGSELEIVFPDQDGGFAGGALVLPCSVAVVAGAPHPEAARELADFLLSIESEAQLARSKRARLPLRAEVSRPVAVRSLAELRRMPVDPARLAAEIERRLPELERMFVH